MSGIYTEAQARAIKKYQEEKTDVIKLRVTKVSGLRDRWKKAAAGMDSTLISYITEAVEARIKDDYPEGLD